MIQINFVNLEKLTVQTAATLVSATNTAPTPPVPSNFVYLLLTKSTEFKKRKSGVVSTHLMTPQIPTNSLKCLGISFSVSHHTLKKYICITF